MLVCQDEQETEAVEMKAHRERESRILTQHCCKQRNFPMHGNQMKGMPALAGAKSRCMESFGDLGCQKWSALPESGDDTSSFFFFFPLYPAAPCRHDATLFAE